MPDNVKKDNMRVLRIENVLTWDKMRVYEEIDSKDVLELSYSEAIKLNIWKSLLILSWRWGRPKPTDYEVSWNQKSLNVSPIVPLTRSLLVCSQPGFTPFDDLQFLRLKECLLIAKEKGIEYVWADWEVG